MKNTKQAGFFSQFKRGIVFGLGAVLILGGAYALSGVNLGDGMTQREMQEVVDAVDRSAKELRVGTKSFSRWNGNRATTVNIGEWDYCALSRISGEFDGGGEVVDIYLSGNMWKLYRKADSNGLGSRTNRLGEIEVMCFDLKT